MAREFRPARHPISFLPQTFSDQLLNPDAPVKAQRRKQISPIRKRENHCLAIRVYLIVPRYGPELVYDGYLMNGIGRHFPVRRIYCHLETVIDPFSRKYASPIYKPKRNDRDDRQSRYREFPRMFLAARFHVIAPTPRSYTDPVSRDSDVVILG